MRSALDYSYVFDRLVWLLLLGLVPIVAAGWAHLRWPRLQCTILGVSCGVVAFPFSLGFYATFMLVVPVSDAFGLIGLALLMLHGSPSLYWS